MTAAEESTAAEHLLAIDNLHVTYRRPGLRKKEVRAVDGVSFTLAEHETVGLVGESGSGKSTIGRAMLGLAPVSEGTINLADFDITDASAGNRRHIATDLQVIFQDPYGSLNPSRTIGKTLAEPLEATQGTKAGEAIARVRELLKEVRLPVDSIDRFPHAFSGGQRQRIAIARALAVEPRLVVCDEAISALDVVTQAQVLNLLREIQEQTGVAYLFIAHNLPLVSYFSDRVLVLYRGRIMEQGDAVDVHERPAHPYTKVLRAAVPVPDVSKQRELRAMRRQVSSTTTANAAPTPDEGCPFAPRCPFAAETCWKDRPLESEFGARTVACHIYDSGSSHPYAGRGEELTADALESLVTG